MLEQKPPLGGFCVGRVVYIRHCKRYNNSMKKIYFVISALVLFIIMNLAYVHADQALLSVSHLSADSIQVTIFGGKPNTIVALHYISNSVIKTINIGTTDSNGNLTTSVASGNYHLMGGVQVYALINGQQSTVVTWPNYSNSGILSLNPAGLSLSVGQTSAVTASVGSNLSIVDNLNPSVASISITGSQITVNGDSIGTTNIIICAIGIGCNTLYVSVGSQTSLSTTSSPILSNQLVQPVIAVNVQPTISLSQSSTTLDIGDSAVVTISGNGFFGILNNPDIRVAVVNISGSSMSIKAVSAGSTNISVCSVRSSSMACVGFLVTVKQSDDQMTTSTNQTVSFADKSINMRVGQNQIIPIYGPGGYSLSQNSGPGSVSANVAGNNVYVSAVAFGGSNITVCKQMNVCATIYVYVQPVQANLTNPMTSNVTSSVSCPAGYPCAPSTAAINSDGATASSGLFSRYLYLGMTADGVSDPDVVALQKRLKTGGFFTGTATGYFGSKTKAAVEAYQKKNGLSIIGVIGPSTRALLNKGI